MTPEERAEAHRAVEEILTHRAHLAHDERTFVHLMRRALESGRSVAPAELCMLDSIWDRVVRECTDAR
jgi:hypothetical protein